MSNQYREGNCAWQSILYYRFIVKGDFRVDEIAGKLGITADCLYRYLRGDLIMPADRIAKLISITDDMEFLNFFCKGANCVPIHIPQGKLFENTDRKTHEINLSILLGELLKVIEQIYSDKSVSTAEQKRATQKITGLIQELKELEVHVKQDAK